MLQRTFNLVVGVSNPASSNPDAGGEVSEVEFSMLDQEDFAGIDEYVKRHGLNDASLAAGRRAREYGVNKEKERKGDGGGDVDGAGDGGVVAGAGEDGLTELQRAEMVLQDQEDEEEEDYEASGGESDGEGEGSEGGSEDEQGYEDEDGEEDAEAEDEEGGEFEEDEL